ncbi:hypothetical protein [Pseudomonas sp. Marseille-Q5115]|uniref:hypothetical protein n=1 Tax=Pseudomonas sp. Marseille-Q5115 TaxID=2866593 RepID=UPI001CE43E9C|nr:hypothetical protein [Pseudomonas sp. Marseille-Q5115]
MINLNSARLAWHDALYTPWDSQGAHIEQIGLLGCTVQKTEKSVNSRHAMHQSISARIQHAIATLPPHLQAFGNYMYSPMATDDDKESADDRVLHIAYAAGEKMTARKFEKARYVAQAVLHRYRRMHQGGQSEGDDPLPTVEKMRLWILAQFGVVLIGPNWERDWGDFVERCFDACNQLDKSALMPVSRAIFTMKQAA